MVGKDNDGNSLNMSEKFSDCVGLRGERGASDNSREMDDQHQPDETKKNWIFFVGSCCWCFWYLW